MRNPQFASDVNDVRKNVGGSDVCAPMAPDLCRHCCCSILYRCCRTCLWAIPFGHVQLVGIAGFLPPATPLRMSAMNIVSSDGFTPHEIGEHSHVPDGVIHVQAHEPTEQQVVVELFHQHSLAAHR